jgi:hypothetical protein
MRNALVILLLASGFAAAQEPAEKQNWQRSKECSAQAAKAVAQGNGQLVQNHYSPKFRRCFAYVLFYEKNNFMNWSLFDAFEGSELATIILDLIKPKSEDIDQQQCFISDGSSEVGTACPLVREFINEHLTN